MIVPRVEKPQPTHLLWMQWPFKFNLNSVCVQHLNGLESKPCLLKYGIICIQNVVQKVMRSSLESWSFFGSCAPSDALPAFLPKIISSRSSIKSSLLPPGVPPCWPAGFLIKASSLAWRGESGSTATGIKAGSGTAGTTDGVFNSSYLERTFWISSFTFKPSKRRASLSPAVSIILCTVRCDWQHCWTSVVAKPSCQLKQRIPYCDLKKEPKGHIVKDKGQAKFPPLNDVYVLLFYLKAIPSMLGRIALFPASNQCKFTF